MPAPDDGDQLGEMMKTLKKLIIQNRQGIDNKIEIDAVKIKINAIRKNYGLATIAQIKDFKDLELKPYKYPGDPDPVQPITTCKWCGSALNEDERVCHNCGQTQISKGKPYERKVPDKGETPSPFGTNRDRYVNPNVPVFASSKDKLKKNKKKPDYAKNDPDTVKEIFVSDQIHQCLEPKRKNNRNVDIRKEEIMRSCEDLAIDG